MKKNDRSIYIIANFLIFLIISILLVVLINARIYSTILRIILSTFSIVAALIIEEKYISVIVNAIISKIIGNSHLNK